MNLRVAVLGLGNMGTQHLRVLSQTDGACLVGACDQSVEACRVAASHAGVSTFSDWESVLALRPDAIVNALPTNDHFEVTKTFLEAGTHVLVEKPIATSVDEAVTLTEIADSAGLLLMVGNVERFNPVVRAAKELIDSNRLGRIMSVAARRVGVGRPAVPRVNVALDLAIHDIDILSFLLGREGRLLLAAGAMMDANRVEDHVDLVFDYGGIVATIQANWITPVKIRQLMLTGTQGFAEVDYIDQTIKVYESAPQRIKGRPWDFFAVSQESEPLRLRVERREPLVEELEHFLACVRTGHRPLTDAESATKALALAVDATYSMRGLAEVR
jgi:UDP-N-acetylglucosamine 3-dehydrogenase